jgi:hypothetical protein
MSPNSLQFAKGLGKEKPPIFGKAFFHAKIMEKSFINFAERG